MATWFELPYTLRGEDGVGIDSATLDDNGGLLLDLTDGTTLGPFPVRGADGQDGSDGRDGEDSTAPGPAGRGITSSVYDPADGSLTLTFTDGTTAGPFPVRGADGTSVTIRGRVDTADLLPDDLGPDDAGDGYITADDGHLHVWTGSAFTDVGSIRGERGLPGEQGVRGTRLTMQPSPPTEGVLLGDININPLTGYPAVYAESAPVFP